MAPKETPSNNLWVSNLSPDIRDDDITSLFQIFGPLDSVTTYLSRGFGFVKFRNINDSKEAKDALQGYFFHGNPLRIEFAKLEQGAEFGEMRDGQYPNRSIDRPDPRLMPQDFVTRQHLPSKVLCISYPPLVHLDNDMIHNAMILLGEINRIRTFYDKNISLVEFRSMEEAQRAKEGLQGKLYNDPRITIDYSSNENDSSYPHKRTSDRGPVLDEQFGLGPFGSNVPSGPATVSQANNSDARISAGKYYSVHDYIWRGIIAKNGASVCRAVSFPIGESIRCELPDVVNCSARTGLDRLTKHYADAAVGFSIIFFLPDTDNDSSLYEEFLRYLSSKDRAGVAKLGDGTHMFLVPPSDFIRKVLKVDGPPCLYGVVLKSAPSGTSFPPESYQPRYVDSPELTSSQIVQARPLLTSDLIASLSNFQPSGRVEGTAGASAGIPASDITVAPESWRYVDR